MDFQCGISLRNQQKQTPKLIKGWWIDSDKKKSNEWVYTESETYNGQSIYSQWQSNKVNFVFFILLKQMWLSTNKSSFSNSLLIEAKSISKQNRWFCYLRWRRRWEIERSHSISLASHRYLHILAPNNYIIGTCYRKVKAYPLP